MLNSQLFLALSTLRYKRLRLRTVGFIILTLAMALTAFGCSYPGESTPDPTPSPCPKNTSRQYNAVTGKYECLPVIRGHHRPVPVSNGGY